MLLDDDDDQGTKVTLDAARRGGCKSFVHCSSIDVGFNGKDSPAMKEDAPYTSHSDPYSSSKTEAEKLAIQYDDPNGMRVCSCRLCCVYGEGDKFHVR